jgi:hypothetical protein
MYVTTLMWFLDLHRIANSYRLKGKIEKWPISRSSFTDKKRKTNFPHL